MLEFLKYNYSLYLSMFLLSIGLGFQQAFIAPLGSSSGIEHKLLNFIISSYYIGFLTGVYIVPKIIKKVGYVRAFSILGTIFSAVFIAYALFKDSTVWFILRIMSGFCFSGLYLITESWINSSIENNNRGKAISLYAVMIMSGSLIGNFMIRYLDETGLKMLAITSFMLSLSFIPVLLMRFNPQPVNKGESMSIKQLYNTSPMGSIGVLFVGMGYGLLTMMPIYISGALNADKVQISNFMVFGAIMSVPATYLIGRLSDKIDRRIIIVALSGIALFGSLLIYSQNTMNIYVYIAYTILYFGTTPLYSVCIAQTNDWLDKDRRFAAAAKLSLMYGMGSIAGSIVTSIIIIIYGDKALVIVQNLLYIMLISFTFYRYFTNRVKPKHHAKFVPISIRPSHMGFNIYSLLRKKKTKPNDNK